MPNKCAMKDCSSNGKIHKDRRFFRFPLDPIRSKAWVEATGRTDLSNYPVAHLRRNAHVCDLHFSQADRKTRNLKPTAIPLPFNQIPTDVFVCLETTTTPTLPHTTTNTTAPNNTAPNTTTPNTTTPNTTTPNTTTPNTTTPNTTTPNTTTNTNTPNTTSRAIEVSDTDDDAPSTSTVKKRKPRNTKIDNQATSSTAVRKCTTLLIRLKRLQEQSDDVNTDLFTLFNFQLEVKKLKKQGISDGKLRLFGLQLFISAPATYRALHEALMLPSIKELRRTCVDIETVMSVNAQMFLQKKANLLKTKSKYCTLCLKKMPLKRFLYYHINKDLVFGFHNIDGYELKIPATAAYSIMARGLTDKWELPMSYCFVAEGRKEIDSSLNLWLDAVISQVIDIGFNVVALVVDHVDLYHHFRRKIVSFTQPYFCVDGIKIYCIFDLPQLVISLRDTLMKHELQFFDEDGLTVTANWGTISALHTGFECDNRCPLVPKLTKVHICPKGSEKKVLKYAAQVFSGSVSQALAVEYSRRQKSDSKIRGTQLLAALVNDIFDILNSSTINHHNKCKNAFNGEPYQMKAIRQFMEFLTNVKPQGSDFDDASFSCINGLRVTVMSFSIILRDLLPKGISSLVTHRFNLDAVDRFFDLVREKSKSDKPTAIQFYKYHRRAFVTELMKAPRTPLPTDNLISFMDLVDLKNLRKSKLKYEELNKIITVGTVDYRFELPETNEFLCICWYLLKKCFEVHKCDRSKHELDKYILSEVGVASYDWESYFQPPAWFVAYVRQMDDVFHNCFAFNMRLGLAAGMLSFFVQRGCAIMLFCTCFPITHLRRLFVRMRIFQIIRYNNKNLKNESFIFHYDKLEPHQEKKC